MTDTRAAAQRLESDLTRAEPGDAIDWPFRIEDVRAVVDAVLYPNRMTGLDLGHVLIEGKPHRMVRFIKDGKEYDRLEPVEGAPADGAAPRDQADHGAP